MGISVAASFLLVLVLVLVLVLALPSSPSLSVPLPAPAVAVTDAATAASTDAGTDAAIDDGSGGSDLWTVDAGDLGRAIDLAATYLVRHSDAATGRFTYQTSLLDPPRPDGHGARGGGKYNLLRHAGAIYALGMAHRRLGGGHMGDAGPPPSLRTTRDEIRGAMVRAADFLWREGVGPVPAEPGGGEPGGTGPGTTDELLAVWSTEAVSGRKGQKPTAKLGGAGLALVGLTSLRSLGDSDADGDDGTDEDANEGAVSLRDLRRLGNFILFLQDGQTGGFTSRYIPSKGGRDGSWTSLYYPGEAALGLMMLYEAEDDDAQRIRWYRGASRAIRYLYEVRKDLPLAKVEPDHWALIATERLLAQYDRIHPVASNSSLRGDREGGASLATREQALSHAAKVCRHMVLEPAELGRRRGCQVSNGSTCSTSTRLEGYAAALAYLPSETAEEMKLRDLIGLNMDAGVGYLLAAQVTEPDASEGGGNGRTFLSPYSRLSLRGCAVCDLTGAFPATYPPDPKHPEAAAEVRVDFVQHALSAMVGYERTRGMARARDARSGLSLEGGDRKRHLKATAVNRSRYALAGAQARAAAGTGSFPRRMVACFVALAFVGTPFVWWLSILFPNRRRLLKRTSQKAR